MIEQAVQQFMGGSAAEDAVDAVAAQTGFDSFGGGLLGGLVG